MMSYDVAVRFVFNGVSRNTSSDAIAAVKNSLPWALLKLAGMLCSTSSVTVSIVAYSGRDALLDPLEWFL